MLLYRFSQSAFARDLSGEGARLFGGRWNHKLTPCLYTSGSRSLALLEYSVNINNTLIPKDLYIVSIVIPRFKILELPIFSLPQDWNSSPASNSTKDIGTSILQSKKHCVIAVPSAIIPTEFNYLLNPLHRDFHKVKIQSINLFSFDKRIKQ